jgi:hypothetical protein
MNKRKKQRNKPIVDISIFPVAIDYSIEAERVANQLVGGGSTCLFGLQMMIEANTDPDFMHGCAIRWNNLRDPENSSKQLMIRRCFDMERADNKLHFTVDLVDVVNHEEAPENVH